MLDGEYGLSDLTIGVPVILGKNGVEQIIEMELNKDEEAQLSSAEAVKKTNNLLVDLNIF